MCVALAFHKQDEFSFDNDETKYRGFQDAGKSEERWKGAATSVLSTHVAYLFLCAKIKGGEEVLDGGHEGSNVFRQTGGNVGREDGVTHCLFHSRTCWQHAP